MGDDIIPKEHIYSERLYSKNFTERLNQIMELNSYISSLNCGFQINSNLKALFRHLFAILTKDPSPQVIKVAVETIEVISTKMGEDFKIFSNEAIYKTLRFSFKIKSQMVERICNFCMATSDPSVLCDYLVKLFDERSADVLRETANFIYRYLINFHELLNEGDFDSKFAQVLNRLFTLANNSIAQIRDSSFEAISAFIFVFGDKVKNNNFYKLNHHKIKKIEDNVLALMLKYNKHNQTEHHTSPSSHNVKFDSNISSICDDSSSDSIEAAPLIQKFRTRLSFQGKDNTKISDLSRQCAKLNIKDTPPQKVSWIFSEPNKFHFDELCYYFTHNFSTRISESLFSEDYSISHKQMFSLIDNEVKKDSLDHVEAIFRWFVLQLFVSPPDMMCQSFLHLEPMIKLFSVDNQINPDLIKMMLPHMISKLYTAEMIYNQMYTSYMFRLMYLVCDVKLTVEHFLTGLSSDSVTISIFCIEELNYLLMTFDVVDLFNDEMNMPSFLNLERLYDDTSAKFFVSKFLFCILDTAGTNELTNTLEPLIRRVLDEGYNDGTYELMDEPTSEALSPLPIIFSQRKIISSLKHMSLKCESSTRMLNLLVNACSRSHINVNQIVCAVVKECVGKLLECYHNSDFTEFFHECVQFLLYIVYSKFVEEDLLVVIYDLLPLYGLLGIHGDVNTQLVGFVEPLMKLRGNS